MIYKNKKTGAVVNTTGKVNGADWELLKRADPKKNAKPDKNPPEGEGK